MDDQDLVARLEQFLRARLPDAHALRVVGLARSTEGFSQETFSFDVETPAARRGFVLKREPLAGLLEPYDLEPEFRVLHALSSDPLPSPPTPWLERDPQVLDRPFYVMERLPGDVPIPAPGPDGAGPFDDAERAALAPQVVEALARLHGIDWGAAGLGFLGDPGPGQAAAARELQRWHARIAASGMHVDPPLAEALGWLRANVPATDDITLVHGDFRLGNFLVTKEAGQRPPDGRPRLGDGAPRRPARGRRVVHLAALAWRHGVRVRVARAGRLRGTLGDGHRPRLRSGAAALLRGALGRQDDRHHADRATRLP